MALRHVNFELQSETFAEQTAMLGIVLGGTRCTKEQNQYTLLMHARMYVGRYVWITEYDLYNYIDQLGFVSVNLSRGLA